MEESLKAFMKGIIDYAGLFPPAKLSLEEAIQNYARYRKNSDQWMLARFIIPATRLKDLSPYADELFSKENPFPFSVLGKGTETVEAFYDQLDEVMACCDGFNEEHGDKVTTTFLETKLPREAASSHDINLIKEVLDQAARKLGKKETAPSRIFYEGFLDEGWKKDVETIHESINRHNNKVETSDDYAFAGYKLRCGGVKAPMFPSAKQVAFVINSARNNGLAMKCTAGLHHPVRHYAEEVQTKMHGFLNVFGGALLSHAHNLSDEELEAIICEEDDEQFSFTDEAFSWNAHSISTEQIKELRKNMLISYGSCSFDEPRNDLQKLGLF